MTQHDPKDGSAADAEMAALDALFAQAADSPAAPSDALTARVLADARALQPAPVPVRRPGAGLWSRLGEALGGWQGIGGLAAATCAGLWIGVAAPGGLPDPAALIYGTDQAVLAEDLPDLTGLGWTIEEGLEDAG